VGPLERSGELEILEAVVAGAVEGAGALVVVEGAAGIGKSRLLEETAASAAFLGARPLRARALELERSFAFGVALQLLGPAVAELDERERDRVLRGAAAPATPLVAPDRAAPLPDQPHDLALVHGLYWLAVNLAERQPLLLVVDDAHLADEPSLRLCASLAERIDELPIALVVAARPQEPGPAGELLAGLAEHRLAQTLRPAPLTSAAIETLIAHTLGREPDGRFVAACERLTGGNPYLLDALLAAAASEGLRATATDAGELSRLAPQGVLRTVAQRMGALPPEAAGLARAVSVLGDDAHLRHAAALAGISSEQATRAVDRLAAADVLGPGEPLAFRHPLTAAAIDADLPASARAAGHLRAAELLRADGAPPERLAVHLVLASATGLRWVVDALRAAARRSLALGVPSVAVTQLRRALAEPPTEDDLAGVLLELGRAEAIVGDASASERLEAAADLLESPVNRAQTLRELARTRVTIADHAGAREAYARALAAIDGQDPELRRHLRAEQLVIASLDAGHRPDAAEVAALLGHEEVGATAAGRALLSTLAVQELFAGAPRDRVLALADRALADGAVFGDEGAFETTLYGIVLALFVGEELRRADHILTRMVDEARRAGGIMALASASYSRSWARLIAGRVRDAVDDAQQAVDAGAHGWRTFLVGAHGALTHALLDAGDVDAAEVHVAAAQGVRPADEVLSIQILDARGRVSAERGRHREAADDFLAAGALAAGQRNPLLFATWRSNAALSLAHLGDRDEARALVETELELARAFGAPRGIAVALRALGVIEGGDSGLKVLRESVDVLDGSEAELELMRSLVELGAALRRVGRRTEAGTALGDALDLARERGAGAVEKRATDELALAGARAGKAARRGRAALSPSERRVTQLAAQGLTNREIAEELFVTRKAVEWHLSNAYGKLGIKSRKDLPQALRA
jgi:DNA-binding CsgD family transcriptional regulator